MLAAYPVQRLALYLSVGTGQSASRLWVVGGMYAGDASLAVLLDALARVFVTLDDVAVLQANFLAGTETQELLAAIFHEVVAFYI